MRVLVIPDTHLKTYVFSRAEEILESDSTIDKVVVLGDMLDDWGCESDEDKYADIIDAAIKFYQKYPNTEFVWGNHDVAYMTNGLNCSGHSGYFMVQETAWKKLRELEKTTGYSISYIKKIDNVLFSHGGLSKLYAESFEYQSIDELVDKINEESFYKVWYAEQNPLWFRASDLYESFDYFQVVGHTPCTSIQLRGKMLFTDVFSSYSNGRPIGDQKFVVIDTVTTDFTII